MSSNYDDNVILAPGQEEIDRLTISYAVVKASYLPVFNSLIAVPLDLSKSGLRILDQACANGLWIRDINREAEAKGGTHSHVGTDIVESYFHDVPPNTTFYLQSMTKPWPPDLIGAFDLVHSRFSLAGAGSYPLRDVVAAEASLLKPGGWLQLEEMDLDGTLNRLPEGGFQGGNGIVGHEVWELLGEIFTALGAGTSFGTKLEGWFEEVGLVNVKTVDVVLRYGANAQYGIKGGIAGVAERDYSIEEIQKLGVQAVVATVKGLVKGSENLPGVLALDKSQLETLPMRIQKEAEEQGCSVLIKVVIGQRPS